MPKTTLDFMASLIKNLGNRIEENEELLNQIIEKENKIMAQIDDLNAAIAAEDVELADVQAVILKVDTDLASLAAAVKNGASPTDLTTQIAKIQAQTAALKTGSDQLAAADSAAVPPTPPAAS